VRWTDMKPVRRKQKERGTGHRTRDHLPAATRSWALQTFRKPAGKSRI